MSQSAQRDVRCRSKLKRQTSGVIHPESRQKRQKSCNTTEENNSFSKETYDIELNPDDTTVKPTDAKLNLCGLYAMMNLIQSNEDRKAFMLGLAQSEFERLFIDTVDIMRKQSPFKHIYAKRPSTEYGYTTQDFSDWLGFLKEKKAIKEYVWKSSKKWKLGWVLGSNSSKLKGSRAWVVFGRYSPGEQRSVVLNAVKKCTTVDGKIKKYVEKSNTKTIEGLKGRHGVGILRLSNGKCYLVDSGIKFRKELTVEALAASILRIDRVYEFRIKLL